MSWPVEVPFPFPTPEFPSPAVDPRPIPAWVPMVDEPISVKPQQRLFEHRRLLVIGDLDVASGPDLVAKLLALDSESSKPIELVIASSGGPMVEALTLLDVLSIMRAPVNTLCIGPTAGTAAIVVLCATGRRLATPHATLSLRCPDVPIVKRDSHDLESDVLDAIRVRDALIKQVSARIDKSVDEVRKLFLAGPILSAEQAASAGFIDSVVSGIEGNRS